MFIAPDVAYILGKLQGGNIDGAILHCGMMNAEEKRCIPEDISIIGCDDNES